MTSGTGKSLGKLTLTVSSSILLSDLGASAIFPLLCLSVSSSFILFSDLGASGISSLICLSFFALHFFLLFPLLFMLLCSADMMLAIETMLDWKRSSVIVLGRYRLEEIS